MNMALRESAKLPRAAGRDRGRVAGTGRAARRTGRDDHRQPAIAATMRASARSSCQWTAEQIAILKNGEAVTHELPAGPHRLRAHNTLFWKTHDVVLQPGEHARFKAANHGRAGRFRFLMVLGAAPLNLTVRAGSELTVRLVDGARGSRSRGASALRTPRAVSKLR